MGGGGDQVGARVTAHAVAKAKRTCSYSASRRSCDETAAAVLDGGRKVLGQIVASQDKVHGPYGGVVPELASRRHLEDILPVVTGALGQAGVGLGDLGGIAVTHGPGLVGSLLIGCSVAKALAYVHRPAARGREPPRGPHLCRLPRRAGADLSRSWLSSSPAATPRSTSPAPRGSTRASARPATTPPARPSTRWPSCWGWAIRGAPDRAKREDRGPGAIAFPRAQMSDGGPDFSFSGHQDRGVAVREAQRAARRARGGRRGRLLPGHRGEDAGAQDRARGGLARRAAHPRHRRRGRQRGAAERPSRPNAPSGAGSSSCRPGRSAPTTRR